MEPSLSTVPSITRFSCRTCWAQTMTRSYHWRASESQNPCTARTLNAPANCSRSLKVCYLISKAHCRTLRPVFVCLSWFSKIWQKLSMLICVFLFTRSEIYYKHSRPHPIFINLYVVSSTNTQSHRQKSVQVHLCVPVWGCVSFPHCGPPGHSVLSDDWSILKDHASVLFLCIVVSSPLHFSFSLNIYSTAILFHIYYICHKSSLQWSFVFPYFSSYSRTLLRIRESLRMSGQYISVLNTRLCQ